MGLLFLLLFITGLAIGIVKVAEATIKFVAKPLFDEPSGVGIKIQEVTDEKEKLPIQTDGKEPIKVEVKDTKFNSSQIVEYEGEDFQKFEFRPQTWQQFISQTFAKEQAQTIAKKAKRGIRCHFLLSAIKGHGKTTFVELFAKSLGAKLIQRVGKQIDEDELLNIVNEINTSAEKFVVLFIDEIDTMDWKVLKVLNPIIEQFKINGKKIKPFIFASATINKHLLIKTNPDTLDRIPHHIQFIRYSAEDIAQIVKQYKAQLYPDENISEEIIMKIGNSCKFNPRTSISLLEDFVVINNIEKVLKDRHIIKEGLTKLDIKILEVLNEATRPMGANALAMRVGLGENQYLREYEPFLVEFGYIARIPSRVITDKGRKILEGVK